MPFTSGISTWLSCRFAPEIPTGRGRPVRSVIKWTFDPYLPRSIAFGPVRPPSSRPACSPSRSRSGTSQAHRGRRLVEDQAVEPGPDPDLRPFGEAPVSRRSRRPERSGRQLLPGAARHGHEQDRSQHFAVIVPAPTTSLRPGRRFRHHSLEQLPQPVRHQPLKDSHAGRLPNTPNEMTSKSRRRLGRCGAASLRSHSQTPRRAAVHRSGTPADLFQHLTERRLLRRLVLFYEAHGQLPRPRVGDEAVPLHHQDLKTIVDHGGHGQVPEPEPDGVVSATRLLNIHQAQVHPGFVLDLPLAMGLPLRDRRLSRLVAPQRLRQASRLALELRDPELPRDPCLHMPTPSRSPDQEPSSTDQAPGVVNGSFLKTSVILFPFLTGASRKWCSPFGWRRGFSLI